MCVQFTGVFNTIYEYPCRIYSAIRTALFDVHQLISDGVSGFIFHRKLVRERQIPAGSKFHNMEYLKTEIERTEWLCIFQDIEKLRPGGTLYLLMLKMYVLK